MPSRRNLVPGDLSGRRGAGAGEGLQGLAQRCVLRPRRTGPAWPRTRSPGPAHSRALAPSRLPPAAGKARRGHCAAADANRCAVARQRPPRGSRRRPGLKRHRAGRLRVRPGPAGLQPVRLGAGQPHGHRELRLAGSVRGCRCLVQAFPAAGRALPRPDLAEANERIHPVYRRGAATREQFVARRGPPRAGRERFRPGGGRPGLER